MKILYKPFGIIAGIVSVRLGRRVFGAVWGKIGGPLPPRAGNEDASLTAVVGAAVVEASTFAATRAIVDRFALKWFQFLTGIWAGDQKPQRPEK
jgi:hypothetical protein